jgi:tetratricopeptide (TPR) repeat protein
MTLPELATLFTNLAEYASQFDIKTLTGIAAGGFVSNRTDALHGIVGQKLWQTSKKWYQKKVADLDVPVNATLQRAIRRSYLTSLVQTCDESILYIQRYENGDESLASQRTKLQALYYKLKRTLPTLCSFPLEDADYQIRLIEIIRTHLTTEIDKVATQQNLPSNPADTVFDQLVLWDYTHTLSERQLLLQDEVHGFVLHELQTTRGLDVPDALETLLRLGWPHKGEKQTFFELMCRNFSEEIKHEEGVSEIFNAKLLAMLRERIEVVLQEVRATKAGIQRVESQLTTLPEEVADRVVAKMITIDFSLYEKHRQLSTQLTTLDEDFAELTQKIQKRELKIETTEDDETRELLADTLQDLSTKRLLTDQQRTALRKELAVFENDVRTLALSLYSERTADSPRLQMATTLFEQGDIEGANRVLNPDDLERDKVLIEKAEAFLGQKKQTLAQEYLTKAKLITLEKSTPNWFVESKYYYTEAVNLHEDYDNCFEAAHFLQTHNQHSASANYYEKAIKYVADPYQGALILNNLANLHSDTQQLSLAEEEYREALDIRRTLAAGNPQAYLPDVAMTLNNLAVLHSATQQLSLAEEEYREALDTYRTLAAGNPQAYLPDVAMTLNNLAVLHKATQQLSLAEEEYREALDIRRTLATHRLTCPMWP